MVTPRSGIDQILREVANEGDLWDPRGQERILDSGAGRRFAYAP